MSNPTDELPVGPDDDANDRDETREPRRLSTARPSPGARQPGDSGGRGRRWVPWAIASGIVTVLAAVAVILALTVFSSSNSSSTGYQARVDQIMNPVISANRSLSRTLTSIGGTNPINAERQVGIAQAAVLTARGGLAALTVPSGSEQLALNARGTLTRETTYMAAIREALMNPASGSATQTQTLAGNLTNALDVIAPADDDWSSSVSGADALTAWAPRAVARVRSEQAAIDRRRVAQRRRQAARARPRAAATPAPSAPAAPSNGTDCGNGLHAGPNTSCPFALNVRQAYDEAPGAAATVEVYSPVTNQSYAMSCAPAGNGVTCSGANDASVTW